MISSTAMGGYKIGDRVVFLTKAYIEQYLTGIYKPTGHVDSNGHLRRGDGIYPYLKTDLHLISRKQVRKG